MGKYLLFGAASIALLLPSATVAQPVASDDQEQHSSSSTINAESLRQMVAEQLPASLAENDVPSASIAYIQDGKMAWTFAAGESEPGKPATPETLYNIASMTKALVAETVVRLAKSGAFSLDDSMASAWVDPDIKDDPRHELLTPRLSLTHRTGFPNWRYQTDNILKFQSDPDSQFTYSGEGMQYVARFLEKKLNSSLEELVAETIFKPAGMKETTFTDKTWLVGRMAMSQNKAGERDYAPRRKTWNAADDVWSSSGDFARFMIWVMANPINGERAETYWVPRNNLKHQICQEGRIAPPLCPKSLGFTDGWSIYDTPDNMIVMHGGGDEGERTLGYFNPVTGSGAVIFTNGANGQKVIRDVVKILLPDPSFVAFMTMQAGG